MKSQVICHDKDNNQYAVTPDQLKMRPSAYGLLIEDGKILLSKQWDGYDFPGGGMEIDETWEETLIREFQEETGLDIQPLYPIFATSSFFRPYFSKTPTYWNCSMVYFLVKRLGGELSIDGCDEFEKKFMDLPEWISLDDLAGRKFHNSLGEKSLDLIKRAQEMQEKISSPLF